LGSTTKEFLEKTIKLVNSLQPEFILFWWDLVDFDDYQASDFEILHTLQVPMYFITGNHEY
jgi:predicted MPP superfamily phosphohydrolase